MFSAWIGFTWHSFPNQSHELNTWPPERLEAGTLLAMFQPCSPALPLLLLCMCTFRHMAQARCRPQLLSKQWRRGVLCSATCWLW
jgi:hypothetical protein